MSRLPHFLDNWFTDGGEVVSLLRRPRFILQEDTWYSVLLEAVRGLVRLEGLGK
jgi:hypothetical protein